MKSEIVVSLDIGTTKICCMVARAGNNGLLEVLSLGVAESDGIRRGVVHNIGRTVEAINKAVKKAREISGVDFDEVYVGIAGQHIRSMQHRGYLMTRQQDNEISKSDIDKLVSDMYGMAFQPGEKIIHVLPQEYTIDSEEGIKDPVGMSGARVEASFHIIIGQSSATENIHKCVNRADLKVKELILEPLASASAVLDADEMEAGVVLVDIGGGTTDVAIFHEGIIRHTAVIPLGGNIITSDIKQGCHVMKHQAEALKVKFGHALAMDHLEDEFITITGFRDQEPREISAKNLAYIIEARMEEILSYVREEIQKSEFGDKLIAGMVLTGGGSQLSQLAKLAEFVTGLRARVGFPAERLSKASVSGLANPIFATGVGLLMKGIEHKEKYEDPQQFEEVMATYPEATAKGESAGVQDPQGPEDGNHATQEPKSGLDHNEPQSENWWKDRLYKFLGNVFSDD